MRGLIVPKRKRLSLPGGSVGIPRIDWSHPLTRGLVGCYVAPMMHINLAVSAIGVNHGVSYAGSPDGSQAQFNGSSQWIDAGPSPALQSGPAMSIFARFSVPSSSQNLGLISNRNTSNSGISWAIGNPAGSFPSRTFNLQVVYGGVVGFDASNNVSCDGGAIHSFSCSANSGSIPPYYMYYYFDGNAAGAAYYYSGWTYPTCDLNLWISNWYYSSSVWGNIPFNVICTFNRQLSDQENLALHLDPYGLLIYPEDELWLPLAVTPSGAPASGEALGQTIFRLPRNPGRFAA